MFRQSLKPEKGQGLVEYALILVLVSMVVILVLTMLGPIIGNVFSQIMNPLGLIAEEEITPEPGPVYYLSPEAAKIAYCDDPIGGTNVHIYQNPNTGAYMYIGVGHGEEPPLGFVFYQYGGNCPN